VAEGGEEPFDLGRVAGRTADLLITVNQNFKVLIAFHAVIFKDGHTLPPYLLPYVFNITPLKDLFQFLRRCPDPPFHDILPRAYESLLPPLSKTEGDPLVRGDGGGI
jgi:hypothetical protein